MFQLHFYLAKLAATVMSGEAHRVNLQASALIEFLCSWSQREYGLPGQSPTGLPHSVIFHVKI